MKTKLIAFSLIALASLTQAQAGTVKCKSFDDGSITFAGPIDASNSNFLRGLNIRGLTGESALFSTSTDHSQDLIRVFGKEVLIVSSFKKSQNEVAVSEFYINQNIGVNAAYINNYSFNPYSYTDGIKPDDSLSAINAKLFASRYFGNRLNHRGIDFTCVVWE